MQNQRCAGRNWKKKGPKKRARTAEVLAGIKSGSGTFNVALDAMQKKADQSKIRADAANTRSSLLTPTKPEQDDANIAAALAKASGKPSAEKSTISERLAALKK
jgi:Mrp family chromosome partitioning ATPase